MGRLRLFVYNTTRKFLLRNILFSHEEVGYSGGDFV